MSPNRQVPRIERLIRGNASLSIQRAPPTSVRSRGERLEGVTEAWWKWSVPSWKSDHHTHSIICQSYSQHLARRKSGQQIDILPWQQSQHFSPQYRQLRYSFPFNSLNLAWATQWICFGSYLLCSVSLRASTVSWVWLGGGQVCECSC